MLSLHGLWMEGARKQSLQKPQTPTSNKKILQRPLQDKTINLARPPALKFHFGFCHMILPLTSQEPQTKPPSPLCLSCFLKFYPLYIYASHSISTLKEIKPSLLSHSLNSISSFAASALYF